MKSVFRYHVGKGGEEGKINPIPLRKQQLSDYQRVCGGVGGGYGSNGSDTHQPSLTTHSTRAKGLEEEKRNTKKSLRTVQRRPRNAANTWSAGKIIFFSHQVWMSSVTNPKRAKQMALINPAQCQYLQQTLSVNAQIMLYREYVLTQTSYTERLSQVKVEQIFYRGEGREKP